MHQFTERAKRAKQLGLRLTPIPEAALTHPSINYLECVSQEPVGRLSSVAANGIAWCRDHRPKQPKSSINSLRRRRVELACAWSGYRVVLAVKALRAGCAYARRVVHAARRRALNRNYGKSKCAVYWGESGLACFSEITTPFSPSRGFRGINGSPLPRKPPRGRVPPFIPRSP